MARSYSVDIDNKADIVDVVGGDFLEFLQRLGGGGVAPRDKLVARALQLLRFIERLVVGRSLFLEFFNVLICRIGIHHKERYGGGGEQYWKEKASHRLLV